MAESAIGRMERYLRNASSLDAGRGKDRLAQSPWTNHSWHVTLYVTAKGLSTRPRSRTGAATFEIEFDFIGDVLTIQSSDGRTASVPLEPQSVATFDPRVMKAKWPGLDLEAHIHTTPNETANAYSI